jgi:hypothetical protein
MQNYSHRGRFYFFWVGAFLYFLHVQAVVLGRAHGPRAHPRKCSCHHTPRRTFDSLSSVSNYATARQERRRGEDSIYRERRGSWRTGDSEEQGCHDGCSPRKTWVQRKRERKLRDWAEWVSLDEGAY